MATCHKGRPEKTRFAPEPLFGQESGHARAASFFNIPQVDFSAGAARESCSAFSIRRKWQKYIFTAANGISLQETMDEPHLPERQVSISPYRRMAFWHRSHVSRL